MTDDGIAMLKMFEQFRDRTYPDAKGLPTIGWGHLIKSGEHFDEPISAETGDALFRADLDVHERAMLKHIRVPLRECEQDALTSLVYNIGETQWASSTILRFVNAGRSRGAIADEFTRWVKSGGIRRRGLVRRRNTEAALYLGAWPRLVRSVWEGAERA